MDNPNFGTHPMVRAGVVFPSADVAETDPNVVILPLASQVSAVMAARRSADNRWLVRASLGSVMDAVTLYETASQEDALNVAAELAGSIALWQQGNR